MISPSALISKPANSGFVHIPRTLKGDQLKVMASEDGTVVTLARRTPDGTVSEERFELNAGEFFTRDVISASTYRVNSNDKKIFVVQVCANDPNLSIRYSRHFISLKPVV